MNIAKGNMSKLKNSEDRIYRNSRTDSPLVSRSRKTKDRLHSDSYITGDGFANHWTGTNGVVIYRSPQPQRASSAKKKFHSMTDVRLQITERTRSPSGGRQTELDRISELLQYDCGFSERRFEIQKKLLELANR